MNDPLTESHNKEEEDLKDDFEVRNPDFSTAHNILNK